MLGVLLVVSAVSNPNDRDFTQWFEGRMKARAAEEKGLSGLIPKATGAAASLSTRMTVVRDNYVVFSVFRANVLGREQTYLGVLGQFVPLKD
jgi:hypothetical protein